MDLKTFLEINKDNTPVLLEVTEPLKKYNLMDEENEPIFGGRSIDKEKILENFYFLNFLVGEA